MQIEYINKSVEKYFSNNFKLMDAKFGKNITRSIKKFYDYLRSSENFAIFLSLRLGRPESLSGDLKGCYSVHTTGNERLILRPITESLDVNSLKKCIIVRIEGVCDYHGTKNNWIIP